MMCHGQATPRLRARSGCWESLFPGLLEQDELGNSWLLAWLPLAQQSHCCHGSCKLLLQRVKWEKLQPCKTPCSERVCF